MSGPWRFAPAGGADSPDVSWTTLDLAAGTVYGDSLAVTSRTSTSLTIDAARYTTDFLKNSPDNRSSTWWASEAVDLSSWSSGTPALLLIDIVREDAPVQDGSYVGVAFHSAADPTASTYFSGVYIRRRNSTQSDAWFINDWGTLGGYTNAFADRQRAYCSHHILAARTDIANWSVRPMRRDGSEPSGTFYIDFGGKSFRTWDISGGLWVSRFAGTHYYGLTPPGSPPAATAITPVGLRYAVVPFGANP